MYKTEIEKVKRSTLTVSEVAEYLGVSKDTVYTMVREKKIVHFKIGRRVLFKKDAIENWIQEQMKVSVEGEY